MTQRRCMTVAELIARLQQPDVDPKWEVYLNPYGENLDLVEVQPDAVTESVTLVMDR